MCIRDRAEECCALVGKALNIDAKDVLPASTGVIGQPMVIDPFARGIPAAAEKPVSYTHLDVYKRQAPRPSARPVPPGAVEASVS